MVPCGPGLYNRYIIEELRKYSRVVIQMGGPRHRSLKIFETLALGTDVLFAGCDLWAMVWVYGWVYYRYIRNGGRNTIPVRTDTARGRPLLIRKPGTKAGGGSRKTPTYIGLPAVRNGSRKHV